MNSLYANQTWTKRLLFLTFIFSFTLVRGQGHSRQEMIGFACGFAGEPSRAVVKVSQLMEARKYHQVSGLLSTGNNAEKVLAVIAIERLAVMGRYQVTWAERKKIDMIKVSNDSVAICSGCTYFAEVPVTDMFRRADYFFHAWIEKLLR